MPKTYKVVFNGCYGGFALSDKAISRLNELGLTGNGEYSDYLDIKRHHPLLIQVVEELGVEASGSHSNLCIATINSPQYIIEEYDGAESVKVPENIRWIRIE